MNNNNTNNSSNSNFNKYQNGRKFYQNQSKSNSNPNTSNKHYNDSYENKKLKNETSPSLTHDRNNNKLKETVTTPLFNYNKSHNQNQYQPAPFQPAVYHHHHHHKTNNNNQNQSKQQNHHNNSHNHHNHHNSHNHHHHSNNNLNSNQKCKILLEKYNRKYNLISFILLRKNDEYLKDNKYYLNDQSYYEKIDNLIEKRDLQNLINFFSNTPLPPTIDSNDDQKSRTKSVNLNDIEQEILNSSDSISSLSVTSTNSNPLNRLSNFTNSYNCNLFVYTIRKCFENEFNLLNSKLIQNLINHVNDDLDVSEKKEDQFLNEIVEFLFSKPIRPNSFYLIDGDYPKRNLMHYSARYNYTRIFYLILKSFKEDDQDRETLTINYDDNVQEDADDEEEDIEEDYEKQTKTRRKSISINSQNIFKFNRGEFVLAQLCMQTDFNGNTPIHLAAQNNSFDLLKLINPICIKHSQLIYNHDGLNPILLASRHSSIKLLEFLIEKSSFDIESDMKIDVNLLISKDRLYSKNCLHYACGRGCGKDALNVIKYLTNLADKLDTIDINNNTSTSILSTKPILFELIGSISPLVGSIYHVAASNLTRLSSLWYLLNLYPQNGLFISCNYQLNNNLQKIENILDYLDFREFTAVDCLIDSVMNLREMAPPTCKSLSQYYEYIMMQKRHEEEFAENQDEENDNFDILLKKCMYKLLVEFKVKLSNLPRIKNQLQLIEFMKLLVFMCKFGAGYTNLNVNNSYMNINEFIINAPSFESNYCQNFEAFCLNFLNAFIFSGSNELLPLFYSSNSTSSSSSKPDEEITTNSSSNNKTSSKSSRSTDQSNHLPTISNTLDELDNLYQVLVNLYEMTSIIINMGPNRYSDKFQTTLYSFLKSYSSTLISHYESIKSNKHNLTNITTVPSSCNSNSVFLESKVTSPVSLIMTDSADDENTLAVDKSSQPISPKSQSSVSSLSSFMSLPYSEIMNNKKLDAFLSSYKIKLTEIDSKIDLLPKEKCLLSLRNLCRISINQNLMKSYLERKIRFSSLVSSQNVDSLSILSTKCIYFKLPKPFDKLANYLTYNLIDDLCDY